MERLRPREPALPARFAIIVLRRRTPAAIRTTARAPLVVADLFEPRRVRLRTAVASPCRPAECPSPGETAQTAWRLRSGWRRTPPPPAEANDGRDQYRHRSSSPNRSARAPRPQSGDAPPSLTMRRRRG